MYFTFHSHSPTTFQALTCHMQATGCRFIERLEVFQSQDAGLPGTIQRRHFRRIHPDRSSGGTEVPYVRGRSCGPLRGGLSWLSGAVAAGCWTLGFRKVSSARGARACTPAQARAGGRRGGGGPEMHGVHGEDGALVTGRILESDWWSSHPSAPLPTRL